MGSDTEPAKKKKKHEVSAAAPAGCCTTVEGQLNQLQQQLSQQAAQIKDQQDKIQNLQQQLQQDNSQLSGQSQQMKDEIKQAEQKAAAAQDAANAANATSTEVKTETVTISKSLQESQKSLDRLLNPEKYLPKPTVVQAVAPIRVLPIDPPKRDGLVPAFRIGAIRVTPYGFLKATVINDTSSPDGDDFPFPGIFLNASNQDTFNTGPNNSPEFHVKARSTRFGANFEWPDMSRDLILTGRVEGDLEGGFTEVNNADVTSIRNPQPRLRLAWARLDYKASDKTDFFFKGGQDWSLFGSSALPNLLETTLLGGFYGSVYTRAPQLNVGLVQDFGTSRHVKFSPEVGVMMPSDGQILKLATTGGVGLAEQIGEGEREGADSDRPQVQARAVIQFQLDKAPGVAPAQLIVNGFEGKRTSIVTSTSTVAPAVAGTYGGIVGTPTAAETAVITGGGFTASSYTYGVQVAVQLPTRWVTVVVSAYRGGDLRFYAGSQINTYATDVTGLTNLVGYSTTDGGPLVAAGEAVLGTNAAGNVVVAPQKPIRAFGGFAEVGLPLSRWFNASPTGHNAGWQLILHAGKDQIVSSEFKDSVVGKGPSAGTLVGLDAPLPELMSKFAAGTLYYKFNQWCQFGFEQSIYATINAPEFGKLYSIEGKPSREWQDHRTELGPIFTF
jgi:hypothetical protein